MRGEEKEVNRVCQPTWSLYPQTYEGNRPIHAWLHSEGLLPPEGLAALRKHLKRVKVKQCILEAEFKSMMEDWFPAPETKKETSSSLLFEPAVAESEYESVASNLMVRFYSGPLYRNGQKLYFSDGDYRSYPSSRGKEKKKGLEGERWKIQPHELNPQHDFLKEEYKSLSQHYFPASNENLTLEVLKAYPSFPWFLGDLFRNANLPWKFLCILRDKYRWIAKKEGFLLNSYLCLNPKIDATLLQDIPEEEREYALLAGNKNFEWDEFFPHLKEKRDERYLTANPNVKPENVEAYPEIAWQVFYLERNAHFSWEWIITHHHQDQSPPQGPQPSLQFKWNPEWVASNPRISWEIIRNNPQFFTRFDGIVMNPTIAVKQLKIPAICETWKESELSMGISFSEEALDELCERRGEDSLYYCWDLRFSWMYQKEHPKTNWPYLYCFEKDRWRNRLNEVEQLILRRLAKHQVKEFYYQLVKKLNEPGKYYFEKDVREFQTLKKERS